MLKIKPLCNSGIVFFVLSTLLFTVAIQGPDNEKIDIPHYVLNGITPCLLILIFGILIIMIQMANRRVHVDLVSIFLAVRVLLPLISSLYINEMPDFFGNLEISMLCFVAYFIAKNYTNDSEKMNRVILVLFLWICAQVTMEAFMGSVSYFGNTYYYKNDLIIPIGGSNAIAAKIIPCFAFTFCVFKKKSSRIIMVAILFFSLGLTKSRGGIIAGIIVLAIVCVWNGNMRLKQLLRFIPLICIFGLIFIIVLNKTSIGGYAFYSNTTTILERIERWKECIKLFLKYPLFGAGFLSQLAEYNPHNWIISIFARGGIMGILVALGIIISILTNLHGKYNDDLIRGSMCFAIAMLIHGLAEIVMFTYIHDFLFWFMIGIAMNRANKYNFGIYNELSNV